MSIQSDAEMENFGHLHLEYRFGYHFIAHGRLSRKNFLGTLREPPKNGLYGRTPKSFLFNFIGVHLLKHKQTIYILSNNRKKKTFLITILVTLSILTRSIY